MILLKVDAAGVAIREFERDAPRAVDVNRVANRLEALQSMKIKARQVHLLRPRGRIQPIKTDEYALVQLPSILPLVPDDQSSARALLLNDLIIT